MALGAYSTLCADGSDVGGAVRVQTVLNDTVAHFRWTWAQCSQNSVTNTQMDPH
jgi:hypothetical protein